MREIQRLLDTMPSDWRKQYDLGREALWAATGSFLPARPTVQDAVRLLGITAGDRASGEAVVGPVAVPAAVQAEALRALRDAHAANYGAWKFIGIARAIQLALGQGISRRSQRRMRDFLRRSQSKKHGPRGRHAWAVWGGDPAARWLGVALASNPHTPELVSRAVATEASMFDDEDNFLMDEVEELRAFHRGPRPGKRDARSASVPRQARDQLRAGQSLMRDAAAAVRSGEFRTMKDAMRAMKRNPRKRAGMTPHHAREMYTPRAERVLLLEEEGAQYTPTKMKGGIASWRREDALKVPQKKKNPGIKVVMRGGRKTYELPDGRWFLTEAKARAKMGASSAKPRASTKTKARK